MAEGRRIKPELSSLDATPQSPSLQGGRRRFVLFQGAGEAGRRIARTVALACALAAPVMAHGAAKPTVQPMVYEDSAIILKTFPADVQRMTEGVRLRLKTGDWAEIFGNPFGKAPAAICWYAPKLQVAGVCQNAPGVTLTVLVDLRNGRHLSAPGRAALTPDPDLISIGPGGVHHTPSDSLTLIRITPAELVDEGGAQFDDAYGPGGWAGADCYRLKAKGPKGDAWLEKTAAGWEQVTAAGSKACRKRHGG
jgi:hypothetical protein